MKIYFDKNCPICHKEITKTIIGLKCEAHYYYSAISHYANFRIAEDLLIHYTQFLKGAETTILKPKESIDLDGEFRPVHRIKGHLELDLNNLEAAIKQVNDLIISS